MRLMKDACELLLNHLVLFFVPVTLGVMLYGGIISKNMLEITVIIVLSTVVTLVVTALVVEFLVDRKKKTLNNE